MRFVECPGAVTSPPLRTRRDTAKAYKLHLNNLLSVHAVQQPQRIWLAQMCCGFPIAVSQDKDGVVNLEIVGS